MAESDTRLDVGERTTPSSEVSELVHQAKLQLREHRRVVAMFGNFAQECYQTPYAEQWAIHTEDLTADQLRDLFAPLVGRTVVDLGCGASPIFRELIAPVEPETYIGVDHIQVYGDRPYVVDDDFGTVIPIGDQPDDFVEGYLVRADMLNFVSHLPDNFASFALNGMDGFILEPRSEYARVLAREIKRVTAVGGGVVGAVYSDSILDYFSADEDFSSTPQFENFKPMHFHIHTKVSG